MWSNDCPSRGRRLAKSRTREGGGLPARLERVFARREDRPSVPHITARSSARWFTDHWGATRCGNCWSKSALRGVRCRSPQGRICRLHNCGARHARRLTNISSSPIWKPVLLLPTSPWSLSPRWRPLLAYSPWLAWARARLRSSITPPSPSSLHSFQATAAPLDVPEQCWLRHPKLARPLSQ
jgi:hypothetical protein